MTMSGFIYGFQFPANSKITIGSEKPVEAGSGQAFFMAKGTPHGFRNIGVAPATVLEIFVKDGPATAEVKVQDVVLAALAKH